VDESNVIEEKIAEQGAEKYSSISKTLPTFQAKGCYFFDILEPICPIPQLIPKFNNYIFGRPDQNKPPLPTRLDFKFAYREDVSLLLDRTTDILDLTATAA
jgi:hypothetical protein